jgi:hypothetical protein
MMDEDKGPAFILKHRLSMSRKIFGQVTLMTDGEVSFGLELGTAPAELVESKITHTNWPHLGREA